MLNSAIEILHHFAPASTFRCHFEYFQILRIDVEEVLYLCEIHGLWFLVFETDYIVDIRGIYDAAESIFKEDFVVEGWIPVDDPGACIDPKDSTLSDDELKTLVAIKYPGNHRYYSTMKLTPREPVIRPSSTAYGGSTTT